MRTAPDPVRIGIVGVGHVGATAAYALLMSGLAAELVLIDQDAHRADGEAMDLSHAVPFTHPTRVWAGDYADLTGALVTIVAAGVGQRPGETRLDLLQRNADVFQDVVPNIVAHNPDGIFLVATNPVDILSYLAWKLSGYPPHRVIGSGTILDTARFRYLLSEHYGVDPRSVHAHIIGEHGDSEVPAWSLTNIAGVPLRAYVATPGARYDAAAMQLIFERTRDAANAIIRGKGATYYAVASGLVRIIEAIVRNQHTILSVSNLVIDAYGISDVYLSLPAIIGRGGVERVVHLPLDDQETAGLQRSAQILRANIQQIRFTKS
jgi:L-lactate dehydrogenase